jgi:hypothetical protein
MTDFLLDPDLRSSLIVVGTLPAVPLVYKSSDSKLMILGSTGDDGDKKGFDDDNKINNE